MGLYLARYPHYSRTLLPLGKICPARTGIASMALPLAGRGKAIKKAEVVESVDTPS